MLLLICYFDFSAPAKSLQKVISLNSLCGSYQDKKTIYLHTSQSVKFSYRDYKSKNKIKCHLELRLPSELFGFYILIEELQLSSNPDLDCKSDYLQFGR